MEALHENIQQSWNDASERLENYHDSASAELKKRRKTFTVPVGSLVYVRLPPWKGQSAGLQSFNYGLWKLLKFDRRANKCTAVTRVETLDGKKMCIPSLCFPLVVLYLSSPLSTLRNLHHRLLQLQIPTCSLNRTRRRRDAVVVRHYSTKQPHTFRTISITLLMALLCPKLAEIPPRKRKRTFFALLTHVTNASPRPWLWHNRKGDFSI